MNATNNNLAEFLRRLADRLNEYRAKMNLTYFSHFRVTTTGGSKYIKVFRQEMKGDEPYSKYESIVAFVDSTTGDILKPASWKAPAKIARGNINSPQFGMEAIDGSGFVKYLK
jgi:hypothetical protein